MRRTVLNPTTMAAFGFGYGFALMACGFMAGAFGHGTGLVFQVVSSPLPLIGIGWLAFFGIPFFWATVGLLLGSSRKKLPRALYVATMVAHFVAIPLIAEDGGFGDPGQVQKVLGTVVFSFIVYGLGQFLLLAAYVIIVRDPKGKRLGIADLLLAPACFLVCYFLPGVFLQSHFHSLRDKDYDFNIEPAGHEHTIRLVNTHQLVELPAEEKKQVGSWRAAFALSPDEKLFAAFPGQVGGMLCTWSDGWKKLDCAKIPQPAGVGFDSPHISISPKGDQFLRWTIGGNRDHGLALRKRGAVDFVAGRSSLDLGHSHVLCNPDGKWFLLRWEGRQFKLSAFAVNDNLTMNSIGDFQSTGHHTYDILDATFLDKNRLHVIWANVDAGGARGTGTNWLQMRTVTFEVNENNWGTDTVIWRMDRFTSTASPKVHVLNDSSIHYLWCISEGQRRTSASGIFYHAEKASQPVKLSDADQFQSVAVGPYLVVCYSEKDDDDKVQFRVIQDGKPGPEETLAIPNWRKEKMNVKELRLAPKGENGFWLLNSNDLSKVYQVKVVIKK